jgi:transcriptional regulator with GAF, ATPase, and Fis domain
MSGPGTQTVKAPAFCIEYEPIHKQNLKLEPESEPWRRRLVGKSEAISGIIETIRLVAPRRTTVLITGETGTGKEAVARALHDASPRAARPMVAFNCAAVPESLFESELFGHAKGAFTGAASSRVGYFERAHGGTIFLDEVGEMPPGLQGKLLRVLQEKEIERLGGCGSIPVDCRIIAASNLDLSNAARNRGFRSDLFYRLSVVTIHVPPLRERLVDVPPLAEHFLEKTCRLENLRPCRLSAAALRRLTDYHWPGNIRELEHAVESAVVMANGRAVLHCSDFRLTQRVSPEAQVLQLPDLPTGGVDLEDFIRRAQLHLLIQALRRAKGNKSRAANLLGMKRTSMIYRAHTLGHDLE